MNKSDFIRSAPENKICISSLGHRHVPDSRRPSLQRIPQHRILVGSSYHRGRSFHGRPTLSVFFVASNVLEFVPSCPSYFGSPTVSIANHLLSTSAWRVAGPAAKGHTQAGPKRHQCQWMISRVTMEHFDIQLLSAYLSVILFKFRDCPVNLLINPVSGPHWKSDALGITPEQVWNPEPPDSRPCVNPLIYCEANRPYFN
jgi:hypothetical protein